MIYRSSVWKYPKRLSATQNYRLGKRLNDSIYVSLTDHINFAIQRNQKGLDIKNALLWETKRLYKDEFAIGKEALVMVKNKTGVSLPEDEAGFIALHIVNAEPE